MATILKFTVLPPSSSWTADGEEFGADDEHTVEQPSEELLRAAGGAHHAGVIEVSEGLVDDHVESQEESEAKLAEAMGTWVEPTYREDGTREPGYWDGPWYEGHMNQLVADQGADRTDVEIDVVPGDSSASVLGKDA